MANVNLTINGKALSVPAGTTILEAAKANDIYIPTLCFLKELDPHASCRMCVVEVEGARTFQHACAAKVREGMVVHTDTEAVRASRKLTLELLLSNHAVDCHHCLRIGSSRCDEDAPTMAGLLTAQKISTTARTNPRAERTRLFLRKIDLSASTNDSSSPLKRMRKRGRFMQRKTPRMYRGVSS